MSNTWSIPRSLVCDQGCNKSSILITWYKQKWVSFFRWELHMKDIINYAWTVVIEIKLAFWSSQSITIKAIACKPENFRALTGFEPKTSRYRYDALTNLAMKRQKIEQAIWCLSYAIPIDDFSSNGIVTTHLNGHLNLLWLYSSVGQSVAPVSRSHGFEPRWSPEFFRLTSNCLNWYLLRWSKLIWVPFLLTCW